MKMFKHKILKRILPIILSAAMMAQSLPATAFAVENEEALKTQAPALEGAEEKEKAGEGAAEKVEADEGAAEKVEAGENAAETDEPQEAETTAASNPEETVETGDEAKDSQEAAVETASPAQGDEEEINDEEIETKEILESESEDANEIIQEGDGSVPEFRGRMVEAPSVTTYAFSAQIEYAIREEEGFHNHGRYDANHNWIPSDYDMAIVYSSEANAGEAFDLINNKHFKDADIGSMSFSVSSGLFGDEPLWGPVFFSPIIKGLTPNTKYSYRIFARMPGFELGDSDVSRFWVACSDTLTFTTREVSDVSNMAVELNTGNMKAGFNIFNMEATVTNPDNVYIEEKGFYIGETKSYYTDKWKEQGTSNGRPQFSTTEFYAVGIFRQSGNSVTIKPYIKVQTGIDDEGNPEYKEITGTNSMTLTARKDQLDKDPFTLTADVTSINVAIDMEYDSDVKSGLVNSAQHELSYTIKPKEGYAGEEKTGEKLDIRADRSNWANIVIDNLEPDTEYTLDLELALNFSGTLNSDTLITLYKKTANIKTIEDKQYTDADIPDAALRQCIKNAINDILAGEEAVEDDSILTAVNLKKVRTLTGLGTEYIDESELTSLVKNLKGISYLENLETLDMSNQNIEDISLITGLKHLASANFSGNRINKLPDLSKMDSITDINFKDNEIPGSEFAPSKLPTKFEGYIEDMKSSQRPRAALKVGGTYPIMTDDNALVFVGISGMREGRNWTVEAKINGENTEITNVPTLVDSDSAEPYTGYYVCVPKKLAAGSYSIEITAKEAYNDLELTIKKDIELKALQPYFTEPGYIDNANISGIFDSGISYEVYVPDIGITSAKAYLTDTEGNIAAFGRNGEPGYEETNGISFKDNILGDLYLTYEGYKEMRIRGSLSFTRIPNDAGSYNLVIETTEGKKYEFPGYLNMDSATGVVTGVSLSGGYDNSGEYLYVQAGGRGLAYDKIKPQITLDDGTAVTEFVSRIGDVYKLKKLSDCPTSGKYPCKFLAEEGYKVIYGDGGDTIDLGSMYISYDSKTQEYIMHAPKDMEGREEKLLLLDKQPKYKRDEATKKPYLYWSEESVRGSANVTVKGAKTKVDFVDKDKKPVLMTREDKWYYVLDRDTDKKWGNIRYINSSSGENKDSTPRLRLASARNFKDVSEIPFEIYAENYGDGLKAGDVATVALSKYVYADSDKSKKQKIKEAECTFGEKNGRLAVAGKIVPDEKLAVGEYYIEALCTIGGKEMSKSWAVYVYDDAAFYQTYQESDTRIYNYQYCTAVTFSSANPNLDADKFTVEFYDAYDGQKKKIDVKKEGQEKTEYGDYTFYYSGVAGTYIGVYVKVLYDGKIGVSMSDGKKSFYEAEGVSTDYGYLYTYYPYAAFEPEENSGICRAINYVDDYWVDIYDDVSGELVTSFNVKKKGLYIFTGVDLAKAIERDGELSKLYTLIARKGNMIYAVERGCNIGFLSKGNPEEEVQAVSPVILVPDPGKANKYRFDTKKGTVTLSCATAGAKIYYVANKGSNALTDTEFAAVADGNALCGTASPKLQGGADIVTIDITESGTKIKAVAEYTQFKGTQAAKKIYSAMVTAEYDVAESGAEVIESDGLAMEPADGLVAYKGNIRLTAAAGYDIWYTFDSTKALAISSNKKSIDNGTKYTKEIELTESKTIYAVAVKAENGTITQKSAVKTFRCTVPLAPVPSVRDGSVIKHDEEGKNTIEFTADEGYDVYCKTGKSEQDVAGDIDIAADAAGKNKTITLTAADEGGFVVKAVAVKADNQAIKSKEEIFKYTVKPKIPVTGDYYIEFEPGEDSKVYTGGKIEPKVVVKYGKDTLEKDVDYTVSYSNNINAAERDSKKPPTVTVKGKNNLAGTFKLTFDIERRDINGRGIEKAAIYVVKGKALPVPSIWDNGVQLKDKKDFTYSNENMGETGNTEIAVTGAGNYKGSTAVNVVVVNDDRELKKTVKKFKVKFDPDKKASKELVYKRGADYEDTIKGYIVVNDGDTKLTEENYTIMLSGSTTDAGTVKYAVVGIGAYSGSKATGSCKIKPRAIDPDELRIVEEEGNREYSTEGTTFGIDVIGDDGKMSAGTDYTIKWSGNTKAGNNGSYTITFKGNYSGKYTRKEKFTIGKASLNNSNATIIVPDMAVKGDGIHKSLPYVVLNDGTLVNKSEYDVKYYVGGGEMNSKNKVVFGNESEKEVTVKIISKGKNFAKVDASDASVLAKTYKVKKSDVSVLAGKDLSKAKVTFYDKKNKKVNTAEYTGEEVSPGERMEVKIGSTALSDNDYKCTYINNIEKGTATLIIMPGTTGDYVNSKAVTYKIVSKTVK